MLTMAPSFTFLGDTGNFRISSCISCGKFRVPFETLSAWCLTLTIQGLEICHVPLLGRKEVTATALGGQIAFVSSRGYLDSTSSVLTWFKSWNWMEHRALLGTYWNLSSPYLFLSYVLSPFRGGHMKPVRYKGRGTQALSCFTFNL